MATTAVSFRKGNTEENKAFAGVAGEIVADLGASTQDTSAATVVLHTGDGIAGGIPMARADMNNITQESINNLANFQEEATGGGTYYGLARRNLSNYVKNDVNPSIIEERLKSDYHIASQDAHDIDTTELTEGDSDDAPGGGKKLATRSFSNIEDGTAAATKIKKFSFTYWLDTVNTKHLAEDSGTEYPAGSGSIHTRHGADNKNLAYADMSNVNTENLATTGAGHFGKDLAYADLTNVGYQTIVDYIDDAYEASFISNHYENQDNKINVINKYAETGLSIQYPTIKAVIDYTADVAQNFTNRYLDNVITWEIASRKEKNLYKIVIDIEDGGADYIEGEELTISSVLHPDSGQPLQIKVLAINQNGSILEVAIKDSATDLSNGVSTKYCTSEIVDTPFIDPNKGATLVFSTEDVVSGKLMRADLTNAEITNNTNTQIAVLHYEISENSAHTITGITSVSGELTDKTTNTFGSFSSDVETGGVVSRLSAITTASSASISQTAGSSLSDLAVVLATFETQTTTTDNYVFTFDGADWYLNGSIVDLNDYGISFTGTPVADDEVTVVYENQKPNKISSVAITKNNAYLNKNETPTGALNDHEIFDTDHELLNRGEINSAIQDAMDAAIATAVVFKGVVQDETYLPSTTASISISQTEGTSLTNLNVVLANFETQITNSGDYAFTFDGADWYLDSTVVDLTDYGISYDSGDTPVQNDEITVVYRAATSDAPTNGDLYWVSAFSSNPPAGMITGRSGSAIWNSNITPADWSYKLDNQNAPDNATLEYSGQSTQQVLKVKIAGAHNGKANALVVESDGLYVKTPVETPDIPTTAGVYHLYVDNLGNVSWVNDARLQVTQ